MFKKGDVVAIAASGGKDSTVLAQVLKTLNERYNYGLKLVLLSIDEGITGNILFEHFFSNYKLIFKREYFELLQFDYNDNHYLSFIVKNMNILLVITKVIISIVCL